MGEGRGEGNKKLIKIGVIGTSATIGSHIYKKELMKINAKAKILELATPKLVPLIEQNSLQKAENAVKLYLKPLQKQGIEALILGCTHYQILEKPIKKLVGPKVKVISQTDFLPAKLSDYLKRHSEIQNKLSRRGKKEFLVTSYNKNFGNVAKRLFGRRLKFKVVSL
jgi:glutamate racemase